ncbi:MAG: ATP-dependent zinc protease [Leptolyngbya sp. SIO1D8]|nr:ATP-dependent zinc protease [Leptolyngbya sp. SIO1D8]
MIPFSEHISSPADEAVVGWREWLSLPELGINQVKAKVDTGARTSALHAFDIEYFERSDHVLMVHFKVHPRQRDNLFTVEVIAPVFDKRDVRNSGGNTQQRPVIRTMASLGDQQWPIELTLTNRDVMGFRMLLGREAIRHRFFIDPGGSYLLSPSTPLSSSCH